MRLGLDTPSTFGSVFLIVAHPIRRPYNAASTPVQRQSVPGL